MDQMRKNSVMIAEISKAVGFNAAEIINKEIATLNKTATELRNRMVEALEKMGSSYQRPAGEI